MCCTIVPYDSSARFLFQHIDAFLQERRVDTHSRSHCSFDNLYRRLGFAPKACDRLLHRDLQWRRPRFDEFDGTWLSKSSVCSIFHRQMTTFHRLPECHQAQQAKVYLQVSDWLRLFFIQEASVGRLTPKVRWIPRMLERSLYAARICSFCSSVYPRFGSSTPRLPQSLHQYCWLPLALWPFFTMFWLPHARQV